MEYLFAQPDKLKKLLDKKFIFLFLDYDGTLTPIVDTPQAAIIPKGTKELLRKLSRMPHFRLGIISGRSLKDIKNIVGLKNIIYAGNHGLEIQGPKTRFRSPVSAKEKSAIRNIVRVLRPQLSSFKGVLIEDKGLTLSIHYRLVDKGSVPDFKKKFIKAIAFYASAGEIKINSGKKVYEIKPPVQWDKGKVVLWFLARQKFSLKDKSILSIYVGDDTTDEDAFRALQGKGLTVSVGKHNNSQAGYYLNNAGEVVEFLRFILASGHS